MDACCRRRNSARYPACIVLLQARNLLPRARVIQGQGGGPLVGGQVRTILIAGDQLGELQARLGQSFCQRGQVGLLRRWPARVVGIES